MMYHLRSFIFYCLLQTISLYWFYTLLRSDTLHMLYETYICNSLLHYTNVLFTYYQ